MTHYQRLGVGTDADASTIRDAYRRLARLHHPDARGGSPTEMAAINEAYAVLSDPGRRLDYDRALRARSSSGTTSGASSPTSSMQPSDHDRRIVFPADPPRFPWRFVVALVVLGIAAVLVLGLFGDPSTPRPIDNVLQVGSCVTVNDDLGEVAEVPCTGAHDAVVESLVPFDGRCPSGLASYRDRQGLGLACVRLV